MNPFDHGFFGPSRPTGRSGRGGRGRGTARFPPNDSRRRAGSSQSLRDPLQDQYGGYRSRDDPGYGSYPSEFESSLQYESSVDSSLRTRSGSQSFDQQDVLMDEPRQARRQSRPQTPPHLRGEGSSRQPQRPQHEASGGNDWRMELLGRLLDEGIP